MTIEVTFLGADEAMADLRKWADEVAPAVAKATRPFADRVADTARGKVPHLSGQLAGSISTTVDDEGAEVGYSGSVPYDGWIEFGGSRGRPYASAGRYLYPTATTAQDEYVTLAAAAAEDTVGSFSWSTH